METTFLQHYVHAALRVLVNTSPLHKKRKWWLDQTSNLIHVRKNCGEAPSTQLVQINLSFVEVTARQHCGWCRPNLNSAWCHSEVCAVVSEAERVLTDCAMFLKSKNASDKHEELGNKYRDIQQVTPGVDDINSGPSIHIEVIENLTSRLAAMEQKIIARARRNRANLVARAAADICEEMEFEPSDVFTAWCRQRPHGIKAARQSAAALVAETLRQLLLTKHIPQWETEYQNLVQLTKTKLVAVTSSPWNLSGVERTMTLAYPHLNRNFDDHGHMVLALLPEIVFRWLKIETFTGLEVEGLPVQNRDDTDILTVVDGLWEENHPGSVYFKLEDALRAAEALQH